MATHALIPILLLAFSVSVTALAPAPAAAGGGGGGGAEEGPAVNPVKGAPAAPAQAEAQVAAVAGQIAALGLDGTEDDRKRKQLEIYRLAAEIAQLSAEFGQ